MYLPMDFNNLASFNPQTCISGKVMRLSRITANVFRKYLKPYDITDSQLSILFILSKKGGLTQKQLSDIAILEKSTLNRNLKRLFDKNYVSRADFPIIQITKEGKKFVNKIIPEWDKAMKEIRDILGTEGEDALNILYSKLLNNNHS